MTAPQHHLPPDSLTSPNALQPPLQPASTSSSVPSLQPMSQGSLFQDSQTLTIPSGSISEGSSAPLTPTTPITPSYPEGKQKRTNHLVDLVETEKIFVDNLTGVLRKVAAAWSRSNLPPPELDAMFRSIEAIYKANRGLYTKLKDISTDPKSAGELGGVLVKWIDDLKKPYETYCTKYCIGFDSWNPVQSNTKLGPILAQFSATNPAPSNAGIWTLDSLFLLPKSRLKYYLKLYNRLLKNTENPLLMDAVNTLNDLMDILEERYSVRVGDSRTPTSGAVETEDEVVIDMRNPLPAPTTTTVKVIDSTLHDTQTGSETSSNRGSASAGERSSRESEATSLSRTSTQTLAMPITDLERRLATDRTLDIFTMTPKAVKLQMAPPSLIFTRELRSSVDVVIRFTPQSTGVEVIHKFGHVFLLSDLFLVCERMINEDRERSGKDGADMWLCYPPLAGKVLRVSEVPDSDISIQVAIMRKEFLVLETSSQEDRNLLLSHFKDLIEFSASLPPPSKQPPPPLPTIKSLPHIQSEVNNLRLNSSGGEGSGSMSPFGQRSMSPVVPGRQEANNFAGDIPPYHNGDGRPPPPPDKTRTSPPANPPTLPPLPFLRPSVSAQPFQRGPSFGPSNGLPPARSTSHLPGPNDPTAGPSFMPPNGHYAQRPPNGNGMQQSIYPPNPNGRSQFPPSGPPGSVSLPPTRPPSETSFGGQIQKSPSIHSLGSQYSQYDALGNSNNVPPLPGFPPGHPNNMRPPNGMAGMPPRGNSMAGLNVPQARPMLPSAQARAMSMAEMPITEPSPPNSPVQATQSLEPVISTISAQMKCKVFLQQHHAQWKSLGSAKLKLYRQDPTNIKQLVVEAENKDKSVLISTIVLTDGVERVGKTGVAIELSDKGARTGIVYMIQLRNEASAGGLFDSLLAGSDRAMRG